MRSVKLKRSAAEYLPSDRSLSSLCLAARKCRGCELYRNATQVVFGQGKPSARMMLVGTMPGDAEDKKGYPFAGPAGRLLDKALAEAGIARDALYITNAVKHFKFVEQKHYRLHRNPGALEMKACRPWLEEEIRAVRPDVIVALGTLAAESLLNRKVVLKNERGLEIENMFGLRTFVTIHPSALLRIRGHGGDYEAEYGHFVRDLSLAGRNIISNRSSKAA